MYARAREVAARTLVYSMRALRPQPFTLMAYRSSLHAVLGWFPSWCTSVGRKCGHALITATWHVLLLVRVPNRMQEMARKRAQVKQAKGPGRVGALLDKRPPLPRRKLQGFLGNSENLVILVEPWFSWLDAWNERFADITKTPLCQDMWSKYEARVNEYGYSLHHPTRVRPPRAFDPSVVLIQS
eukprot:m.117457 g.117457  ORF g.117457 m.117457 type:complete len:184 (-) comp17183_c0_seq51:1780-2331(-)